jgi:hypothetical protein
MVWEFGNKFLLQKSRILLLLEKYFSRSYEVRIRNFPMTFTVTSKSIPGYSFSDDGPISQATQAIAAAFPFDGYSWNFYTFLSPHETKTNTSTISSDLIGLRQTDGGEINNRAGGIINIHNPVAGLYDAKDPQVKVAFGIVIGDDGIVENSGQVLVRCTTGAAIITGDDGTVDNHGTVNIQGAVASAIILSDGGIMNNDGTIAADGAISTGVVAGETSTIRNQGFISSHGAQGEGIVAGDTSNIYNSGKIELDAAEGSGIITGDDSNIINGGTIYVDVADGVGAILSDRGAIENDGTITISAASGADIIAGEDCMITNPGAMSANGATAINVRTGGYAVIDNAGSIDANGASANNIQADGPAAINNSGTMSARSLDSTNIIVDGEGIVMNRGAMNSEYGANIIIGAGGVVANGAGATIDAGDQAIQIQGGAAIIINAGTIASNWNSAIDFTTPIVRDPLRHLAAQAAGMVVNAGTIIAGCDWGGTFLPSSGDAVRFFTGLANCLVAIPGCVFTGAVDGGGALSTLELASGATTGTLTGLGSQFIHFGTLQFDFGAHWHVSVDPGNMPGQIIGFAPGDTMDLVGFKAGRYSETNDILTIQAAGTTASVQLKMKDGPTASQINVINTANGARIAVSADAEGSIPPFDDIPSDTIFPPQAWEQPGNSDAAWNDAMQPGDWDRQALAFLQSGTAGVFGNCALSVDGSAAPWNSALTSLLCSAWSDNPLLQSGISMPDMPAANTDHCPVCSLDNPGNTLGTGTVYGQYFLDHTQA